MKRHKTLLIILAGVAVILAVAILFHNRIVRPGAPASAPQPPAASAPAAKSPPGPTSPAVKAKDAYTLVNLFFSSLKGGNLAGAYAYLSPDLQKTLSYQAFVAGFKGSRLTAYDSSSLRVEGAGNFSLEVNVPYTLSGSSANGPYVATLRCVNLTGGYGQPDWRVQSLNMRPAGTQKP